MTGYTIRIGASVVINNGLNKVASFIRNAKVTTCVYIVTSLTSLGGAIAVALDYARDRNLNRKIKIK